MVESKPGWLRRLADHLLDLVAEDEDSPDSGNDPLAATLDRVRRSRTRPAFEAHLASWAADAITASCGRVQLVGFDDLRQRFEWRWDQIAAKAFEVAEQVIARRLTGHDSYTLLPGEGFMILFPDLTEEQARLKAAAIAHEVQVRLLGEEELADRFWVRAHVAGLEGLVAETPSDGSSPLPLLAALDHAMDHQPAVVDMLSQHTAPAPPAPRPRTTGLLVQAGEATIQRSVFEARLHQAIDHPGTTQAGKVQILGLEDVRTQLGERWAEVLPHIQALVEDVLRHRLRPADVAAPLDEANWLILFAELTEVEARLRVAAIGRDLRQRLLGELPELRTTRLEVTCEAVAGDLARHAGTDGMAGLSGAFTGYRPLSYAGEDEQSEGEQRDRTGEIAITYRPTLFMPRDLLTIYDVRAHRLERDNRLTSGQAARVGCDDATRFDIDRRVLALVLEDMRRGMQGGGALGLVQVPIAMSTLLAHSVGLILDLVRAAPDAVRQHLVIDVDGLDNPGYVARLGEAVGGLRRWCRSIALRLPAATLIPGSDHGEYHPADTLSLSRLRRLGLRSVGIDLDGFDDEPADLTRTLPALARHAHDAGLQCHLYGLTHPAAVDFARQMRFDYANGPAIEAECREPGFVRPPNAPKR